MVDHARGEPRPSLSEAASIDGARSIAVVDVAARVTVWSVTLTPPEASVRTDPATHEREEAGPVRVADDVLDTVRGADRLAGPPAAGGRWSEVILIDGNHYHILRPLGAVSDALVVELVLDARTGNLAAARQRFASLVSAYDTPAPGQAHPDQRADEAQSTAAHPTQPTGHSPSAAGHPVGAADLPRRIAAAPPGAVGPDPAGLVDEPVLDRVATALRTLT